MPAVSKGAPPPETTTEAPEASTSVGASDVPGAFEYTAGFTTIYVAVPLTAHPADDDRSATVFAWPDGAPKDGRWIPTTKTPNQAADNAGPLNTEE